MRVFVVVLLLFLSGPVYADRMVSVTSEDRARLRLPWKDLLERKCQQAFSVLVRGHYSGKGLIGAKDVEVKQGFRRLKLDEFREYNFPQVWVERRMIPEAIDGRIPASKATVLDLGSGPGTSMEILGYFADPSWTLIGYDLTPEFVELANERRLRGEFRNKEGQELQPVFVIQDLSQPLKAPNTDRLLADSSVDFAISGGVVGLYMNSKSVLHLANELWRVLKAGGFIALDAGPAVPVEELRAIVEGVGFVYVDQAKSFVIEPRPKLVFQKPH